MDAYHPEQWHDFFLMVGGGAAALTGLVVVAMSLHLDVIASDAILRHRARSILTGLAAVFMRCGLALMGGQNGRAVGAELFVVCAITAVAGVASFWQVSQIAEVVPLGSKLRTVGSIACYLTEMVGAAILFSGKSAGLYVVGVAMITNFFFFIFGSWTLLVGVGRGEARAEEAVETARR